MSELQDALDRMAKAAEPVLHKMLDEINDAETITDVTKSDPTCVICQEPASHQKLGRDVCTYHWELSNDHKRGR